MAQAYFNCVNDNGGINGHPISYKVYDRADQPGPDRGLRAQADPDRQGGRHRRRLQPHRVRRRPQVLGVARHLRASTPASRPSATAPPNSAAPNMGPRYSSDGAVQAVVRAGAKKIAFDQSNVPGTGYIAAGPRGRGQEPQRADHPVQGQRADPGRELDRAQARAGRRHRRRRRAQLHAARGAEDPPGRAAAGPAGPRQGVGLLDAVQHRLRRQGARVSSGTASCSSTPS